MSNMRYVWMVEQIEERRNRVYKYWESMVQSTVTAYTENYKEAEKHLGKI